VVGGLAPLVHDINTTFTTIAQDLVYEPLLQPDGSALSSRVLARWEPQREGIRALVAEGLRFSDGSPVTPEDVARSAEAGGLAVQRSGRWLTIEPSRDRLPVEATLLNTYLFRRAGTGELGTRSFHLVGQDAGHLILERSEVAPGRIQRVELVSFPSIREAFARALKGEVGAVMGLDDRQVELLEGVPHLRIVRTRGPHALAIYFNSRKVDQATRREVARALPLEEIEELAQTKGCGPPSGQRPIVPLAGGAPLDVLIAPFDSSVERAGLAVRRGLGTRGGSVVRMDLGESVGGRSGHDIFIDNLLVWPPIIATLYWRSGAPWNRLSYSNPAYDAAVDAGDYARAQVELERDPPVLFLCRRERIAAIDARLKNATLGAWGQLETLPQWEVSP